jgi:hypothetical protein
MTLARTPEWPRTKELQRINIAARTIGAGRAWLLSSGLFGGALELLEVLGSGVCTPTEARVDAVDCGGLELAFQEGNALVQPLPDQRVIRELDCSVVPGDVVSPVVLTVNH